jgi:hypothetical protein
VSRFGSFRIRRVFFNRQWCDTTPIRMVQIYTMIGNAYLPPILLFFSLIVSPLTKIPLPLYGSGFLHFLMFAANCMTTSFSGPSSSKRVGCGVLAVTPFGMPSSTGWEYPTFRLTNFWPGYSDSTVVAVFSTEARKPTPTKRRIALWPSLTPRMWFWRYARVRPASVLAKGR